MKHLYYPDHRISIISFLPETEPENRFIRKWFLEDIGVRWEEHQWRAYNIGKPTESSSKHWSTGLGDIEVDEIFTLFRHSNLTFLPCK